MAKPTRHSRSKGTTMDLVAKRSQQLQDVTHALENLQTHLAKLNRTIRQLHFFQSIGVVFISKLTS